jgi:tRNA-dihydrouridine synthase
MIGRGALGNPWIFRPENTRLSEGGPILFPSLRERQRVIEHHFSLLRNHYGDKGAMKEIRRHVAWYTKGLPHSASFRSTLSEMREKEGLFEAIKSYLDFIEGSGQCQSFISAEGRSATG